MNEYYRFGMNLRSFLTGLLDKGMYASARVSLSYEQEPLLESDDIQGNILPGFN